MEINFTWFVMRFFVEIGRAFGVLRSPPSFVPIHKGKAFNTTLFVFYIYPEIPHIV